MATLPPFHQQGGFQYGVKHLLSHEDNLLSQIIHSVLDLSLENSLALIRLGAVYVQNQRALEDVFLQKSTYLRVHTKPRRFNLPLSIKSLILKETPHFLILNKPSGLSVHPTVDNVVENLISVAQIELNIPLYITHRLDVPTSGILVFAKNKQAQGLFNQLLEKGGVQKKYLALLSDSHFDLLNSEKPLLLKHWMEKSPKAPKKLFATPNPGTLNCELIIESENLISKDLNITFKELQIQLLTGRTHQIRAQLSFLKHPILNDTLYGAPKSDPADFEFIQNWLKVKPLGEFIGLRCHEISFTDPMTQEFISVKS